MAAFPFFIGTLSRPVPIPDSISRAKIVAGFDHPGLRG
jgi:hypothetical protein